MTPTGQRLSPLEIRRRNVFRGHLVFIAFRIVSMAAIFLVVMTLFGVVRSPTALVQLSVSLLSTARSMRRQAVR